MIQETASKIISKFTSLSFFTDVLIGILNIVESDILTGILGLIFAIVIFKFIIRWKKRH